MFEVHRISTNRQLSIMATFFYPISICRFAELSSSVRRTVPISCCTESQRHRIRRGRKSSTSSGSYLGWLDHRVGKKLRPKVENANSTRSSISTTSVMTETRPETAAQAFHFPVRGHMPRIYPEQESDQVDFSTNYFFCSRPAESSSWGVTRRLVANSFRAVPLDHSPNQPSSAGPSAKDSAFFQIINSFILWLSSN
jgi:hypothetical protein